jgi:hypothetical protein
MLQQTSLRTESSVADVSPALSALNVHRRDVGIHVEKHFEADARDNLHGLLAKSVNPYATFVLCDAVEP